MSTSLADQECIPCRGGIPPLKLEEATPLRAELGPAWQVVNGHHLEREFTFPEFRTALAFTNAIGELAEAQGTTRTSTSRGVSCASSCGRTRSWGCTRATSSSPRRSTGSNGRSD